MLTAVAAPQHEELGKHKHLAATQAVSGTASTRETHLKSSTIDAARSHVSETVLDLGGSASVAGAGAAAAAAVADAAAGGEVDSPSLSGEQVSASSPLDVFHKLVCWLLNTRGNDR